MPTTTKAGPSNHWEGSEPDNGPEPEAAAGDVAEENGGNVVADDSLILSDDTQEAPEDAATRPVVNAPKADWVDYAVSQGMTREDAEAMTKADLVEHLKDTEVS